MQLTVMACGYPYKYARSPNFKVNIWKMKTKIAVQVSRPPDQASIKNEMVTGLFSVCRIFETILRH